jgi:hypothetical protein
MKISLFEHVNGSAKMSYTPLLLIDRRTLETGRYHIEQKCEEIARRKKMPNPQVCEAYKALRDVLQLPEEKDIVFPQIRLVLMEVEFDGLNRNVRKILNTLKIEFRTSY